MKVAFKLWSDQRKRALEIVKETAVRYAEEFSTDPDSGWVELEGNLCITINHGYGVSPQRLHLQGSTLTYEGERNAMKFGTGNCFHTILRIFGYEGWVKTYAEYHSSSEKIAEIATDVALSCANRAVEFCESSQPNLPWHLTESEAIEAGLVSETRLREILKSQSRDRYVHIAAQNRLAELCHEEFKPFDAYWWRNEGAQSSSNDNDDFVEVNEEA